MLALLRFIARLSSFSLTAGLSPSNVPNENRSVGLQSVEISKEIVKYQSTE